MQKPRLSSYLLHLTYTCTELQRYETSIRIIMEIQKVRKI